MTEVADRAQLRGARERILVAASRLFRVHGIVATQMEAVAAAAPVSKRTLYKHFHDKTALIEAYLQERDRRMFEVQLHGEEDPTSQILGLFAPASADKPIATCPFIAAATEFPETASEPHRFAARHKQAFQARLQQLTAEVGVAEPERVGALISLLYDGAISRSQALDDAAPLKEARRIVSDLLRPISSPTQRT